MANRSPRKNPESELPEQCRRYGEKEPAEIHEESPIPWKLTERNCPTISHLFVVDCVALTGACRPSSIRRRPTSTRRRTCRGWCTASTPWASSSTVRARHRPCSTCTARHSSATRPSRPWASSSSATASLYRSSARSAAFWPVSCPSMRLNITRPSSPSTRFVSSQCCLPFRFIYLFHFFWSSIRVLCTSYNSKLFWKWKLIIIVTGT